MNTELTALTRPRIASGVSICTSVWRTTTLMVSAPPETASASIDNQKWPDRPNTTIHTPNSATASISVRPTRRRRGQRVSSADMTRAPTAGALRSRPSPSGPSWRMSRANMGSRAVAPPSNTANRSSDTAPSSTLRSHTKATPASNVRSVARCGPGATCT